MQVNVDKFLAMTALLALGAMPACTIEASTNAPGATGTGASGSTGTAGSGGTTTAGGSAGSSGTGGAAGSIPDGSAGSSALDASTDGGVAISDANVVGDASNGGATCFPDDSPDASFEGAGSICSTLPSAADVCADDAGAEGGTEGEALFLCKYFAAQYKAAAFKELFDCLKAIPAGQGCATAAADACSTKVLSRTTCTVPSSTGADGGAFGCANVVAACSSTDGGPAVTLTECTRWLHPFNAATQRDIFSCFTDPATTGTDCRDKFENSCVFPPDEP